MFDVIQIVILLLILFYLIGLKRMSAPEAGVPTGSTLPSGELDEIRARLDQLQGSLEKMNTSLSDLAKDNDILEELEESVMEEWEKIIEEKLGKRPVMVPCPSCGNDAGLEPNLLSDEDREFGCPKCGSIFEIERLREAYPDAEL